MENVIEEKGLSDYTEDGTVDLKGKPVYRSKTGRWKACSFVVGYEVFERMAYYGISTNLVLYLRHKLHEGTVSSSNHVTNWVGTVWMLPVLGAYVADARLGRYWTFVIASAIYLTGMTLLTLSVSVPGLKPPTCGGNIKEEDCPLRASDIQKGVFYTALYIIAIGTGGTKPNISTIGADQFDEFEPKEKKSKLSFFNWWMFSIFFGTLFSNTFLVYIQDNLSWTVGYALPTVGLAISIAIFLVGTPFYRHRVPAGSPFTKMAQVFVAASRKRNVFIPNDPSHLHELGLEEYSTAGKFQVYHTASLRPVLADCSFLDKAAVKHKSGSPWMLCPVTQVEETKQMVQLIPVFIATIVPSIIIAQINTLFIQQGTTLERSIGPNFDIPPACLTAFVTISMLVSLVIYDRILVPATRRYTKNPRGISLLQRMGIGLVLQIITVVAACLAEQHNLTGKHDKLPLTIFILLPQFVLMGVADAFVEVARIEFFYDQAPQGMKSLGTSYFTSGLGIGNFVSSVLLRTVANVTKKHARRGWILDNLNLSHLDYYYALLAILSVVNLLYFLIVSKYYVYSADISSRRKESDQVEED
ncbi:Protein NRT1/ PTR FAMILY 5.2 [Linum grandiflorum]